LTDLNKIKVVIIGQDPYPRAGDAHGLAFSCMTGIPASLRNIYKCLLANKLISEIPDSGNLEYWASQGVLLLNTALTTVIGQPNAHSDIWEEYVVGLIKLISAKKPLIFMLWGNNARSLAPHLDDKSIIMEWSHPSPMAQVKQSFIKCTHFKDANKYLIKLGKEPIDWNVEKQKTEVEVAFGFGPKTQVIFTDGSCYPNKVCKEAIAGYAVAFALGSMTDTVLYGNIPNNPNFASNQRAEGTAILKTMEYLQEHLHEWDDAVIVSDSDFWIKMFEAYMPKWAIKDSFESKKNPDLTKKMWDLYTTLTDEYSKTIRFRHVKSHNKDGWGSAAEGTYENFCFINNQYVDELASYARANLKIGEDVITQAKYDTDSEEKNVDVDVDN
jgi:uracil-DNA glycosylase